MPFSIYFGFYEATFFSGGFTSFMCKLSKFVLPSFFTYPGPVNIFEGPFIMAGGLVYTGCVMGYGGLTCLLCILFITLYPKLI